MNILHITTFLQGGAGLAITELARSQSLAGHKVTVVTSRTGDGDYCNYPQWLETLWNAGIEVLEVDSTFKRDVSLQIAALRHVRDAVDTGQLSIIHTHAAMPSMLALLLRSGAHRAIPVMQTMHGWGIRKDAMQAATDIALMNEVDRVVTPSAASRNLLQRLGVDARRISVVSYGIRSLPAWPEDAATGILREWKSRGHVVFLCIGTIGARKNQRLLIEAISSAPNSIKIACAVVGEGEEIAALTSLASERGLDKRIRFFGYQNDAARFLNAADWLVLPSNDEGLPLSVLEAYRAGVPVIGSDIPEISEVVVPGETGFLFSTGDRDSLAQALAHATKCREPERGKMGRQSQRLWQQKYSLERMTAGYLEIYDELIITPLQGRVTSGTQQYRHT
jgi:glycosyltransferase involved in cell wall biosynthesis